MTQLPLKRARLQPNHFSIGLLRPSDFEQINSQPNFFPVRLEHQRGSASDLRFEGLKVGDFCIWKSASKSGFSSVPSRFDDVFTVRFPLSGSLQRLDGPESHNFGTGGALIVPFREMESMRTSHSVSILSCTVGAGVLIKHLQALFGGDMSAISFVPLIDATRPPILALKYAIHSLYERTKHVKSDFDLYYPILEEMIIFQILTSWPRRSTPDKFALVGNTTAVSNAVNFIDFKLAERFSVTEVAAAVGVSVRSLQIGFMSRFGVTPVQYIVSRRLERVREDLQSEYECGFLSDIASRWGFHHLGNFNRKYKEKFGETPSQTRSKHRC
ncbi:AraC family transcriptional regulator [Agrobacterium rosae]|uniref:AraC family transcriptional regulator n=1 Tax=Agrobacterium rosae TaxID=1972867 RepID=UPI0020335FEE|nr:AraC family transcriptional regulator [Agrobacterium rosae]MCM2435926.1 helix-turn-helix transcriptional regulator [Agrobacterium rosae]